jgi:uncharacterized protein YidB (DUF937 family)
MGFMDDLKKVVVGQEGEAGGQSSMLDNLLEMLNDQKSGGINGLVKRFNEKGLGDHMSSWIGTGENLPISADQIQHALGSDKIKELASKLKLGEQETSKSLANILPQLIDRLTPDGSVPHQDALRQDIDMLRKKPPGR